MAEPSGSDVNPYAPPRAPLGRGAPAPERVAIFRSPTPFAQAITVLTILYAVTLVANLAHDAAAIMALQRVLAGVASEPAALEAINRRAVVLQGLPSIFYLALVVLFCMFMVRANRNVHAFRSDRA